MNRNFLGRIPDAWLLAKRSCSILELAMASTATVEVIEIDTSGFDRKLCQILHECHETCKSTNFDRLGNPCISLSKRVGEFTHCKNPSSHLVRIRCAHKSGRWWVCESHFLRTFEGKIRFLPCECWPAIIEL